MDEKVLKAICRYGAYSNPRRLGFYFEKYLFQGTNYQGKTLLDIGGGRGVFAFIAALSGASRVVVMEPEADGSSSGMIKGFYELFEILGRPANIELTTKVLQEFDRKSQRFDIVLMHNSINHIDEEGCAHLTESEEARQRYRAYFELLADVSKPGAKLIVCDCSNKNFWAQAVGVNPIMPMIEWDKHQPPEVWAELLSQRGFQHVRTSWGSFNTLGAFGRIALGNRWAAYLTCSLFRLEMVRS
jgi:cyclopropane fatty-acyl-phospholipid synthase-like methyltransferase